MDAKEAPKVPTDHGISGIFFNEEEAEDKNSGGSNSEMATDDADVSDKDWR